MNENEKITERINQARENNRALHVTLDGRGLDEMDVIKDQLLSIASRLKPGDALVVGYISGYKEMEETKRDGLMEFVAACDGQFATHVSAELNVAFEIHPMALMADMVISAQKRGNRDEA